MKSDEREQEMLDLMREATQLLRQTQNTINEVWAEWTRTHGLRGGVSQPLALAPDGKFDCNQPDATKLDAEKERKQIAEHTRNTVRRTLKR